MGVLWYNWGMDGQEYLNQISTAVRPEKKSGMGGLMGSPIFKVAAVGVIAFIVIIIIGAVLSGGKGGVEKQGTELLLHIDNTSGVISTYQPSLKSSDLRSSSASLYSILSNTSRELTDYLTTKFNYKPKSVDKKWVEAATLHNDELDETLFNAKINGILDRIYAHKMAYEISLITSKESSLYASSRDDALREIINSSYNSLNNLYDKFNDFSETKN